MCFFFFNDTATTEIYTLSLHDALPIFGIVLVLGAGGVGQAMLYGVKANDAVSMALAVGALALQAVGASRIPAVRDRKSTRLNSSHRHISYAGFCLKKKRRTGRTCAAAP